VRSSSPRTIEIRKAFLVVLVIEGGTEIEPAVGRDRQVGRPGIAVVHVREENPVRKGAYLQKIAFPILPCDDAPDILQSVGIYGKVLLCKTTRVL
jgi:hypothetical protein